MLQTNNIYIGDRHPRQILEKHMKRTVIVAQNSGKLGNRQSVECDTNHIKISSLIDKNKGIHA